MSIFYCENCGRPWRFQSLRIRHLYKQGMLVEKDPWKVQCGETIRESRSGALRILHCRQCKNAKKNQDQGTQPQT